MNAQSAEININELDFKLRDKLNVYLQRLIDNGGSDLHVKSGSFIRGRFNGEIVTMSDEILSKEDGLTLAKELLRTNFKDLVTNRNVDFTYKLNDDYSFSREYVFSDGRSLGGF